MLRPPQKPLVAIIGATGTGKSELAVEIARRFNGEIINGDAMQLYHGLPVITNKIPEMEQQGIPHHLLGCIGLEEETWTVGKFVDKALGVSLLFHDILAGDPALSSSNNQHFPILDEPADVILAKLQEVDPIMAERWHPTDRQKIRRSLEMYLKTGKPASKIYEEQALRRQAVVDAGNTADDGGNEGERGGLTMTMRFPALIFWIHASREALCERLDGRIMKMLENGLLEEVSTLSAFREGQEAKGVVVDQTRGIWVSIGYKEFLAYRTALTSGATDAKELANLKEAAVAHTQAATRQYANRQVKWIRIKLLNALAGAGRTTNIFLLDGTDLALWDERVINPATEIAQKFLSGDALPSPTDVSDIAADLLKPKGEDLSQRRDLWGKKTCELCGIVGTTVNDWEQHIKSRAHRRAVVVKEKKKAKEAMREQGLKIEAQKEVVDVLERHLDLFAEEE
ncbi:tRNA isopentenyltransferase [Mytilinidion resinicola]|uniref:tRNA isopentenyltransferase n=1 Tax=Mytilinidion resinicola TaxID=574789 RepID=A0A6A6ZAM8_9PEZI|nr:tRNA isopentenyltransferase [Mytilinidion resinicola]KAF2817759.1 tRNA isopentenyltransferase [Mytilinidion resinicola]